MEHDATPVEENGSVQRIIRGLLTDEVVIILIFLVYLGLGGLGIQFFNWNDTSTVIYRAFIAGITTNIAIFSYRYSVKSNIRGAVGEIKDVQLSDYIITMNVRDVKWRPRLAWKIGRKIGEERLKELRQQTTLTLRIYETTDGNISPLKGDSINIDIENMGDEIGKEFGEISPEDIIQVRKDPDGISVVSSNNNGFKSAFILDMVGRVVEDKLSSE